MDSVLGAKNIKQRVLIESNSKNMHNINRFSTQVKDNGAFTSRSNIGNRKNLFGSKKKNRASLAMTGIEITSNT